MRVCLHLSCTVLKNDTTFEGHAPDGHLCADWSLLWNHITEVRFLLQKIKYKQIETKY